MSEGRLLLQPFESDGLSFVRINAEHVEFAAFCDFFAAQILGHERQAKPTKTHAEVVQGVSDGERALGDAGVLVVCKHGARIVGCVRIAIDTPARGIPFEGHIGLSLTRLRKLGRIMEISRLAIASEHRSNRAILDGLFAWCNNVALAEDIDFVFAMGFPYVVPLYRRLAFDLLFGKGHERHAVPMANGFLMHPMILNFSALHLDRRQDYEQKFGRYAHTDRKLETRFGHRLAVRHEARPIARGLRTIQAAIDPNYTPKDAA